MTSDDMIVVITWWNSIKWLYDDISIGDDIDIVMISSLSDGIDGILMSIIRKTIEMKMIPNLIEDNDDINDNLNINEMTWRPMMVMILLEKWPEGIIHQWRPPGDDSDQYSNIIDGILSDVCDYSDEPIWW